MVKLKEAINTGRWEEKTKLYYPFREEIIIVNDVILRSNRIVIPVSLRSKVLRLAHIGHPGIQKTKQRLRSKVWWPKIDVDAEQTVKSCLDCQLVSSINPPEPMSVRNLPTQPWHTLSMDMLGPLPSSESILVIIDLYSRFRLTEVMQTTTSGDIIKRLRRTFFRMGIPAVLVSDNAKNFSSSQMEEFCRDLGIKLQHTTPYWPLANRDAERQNRSILKILRISQANGSDWKADLEEANYVYSLIQHPATGRSPSEILFGRNFRDWVPEMNNSVSRYDEEVRDHDWSYRQKAKLRYDNVHKSTESSLCPLDRVLMRNLVPQNKLSTPYLAEPATVLEKNGNSVLVETSDGRRYRRNSSHLKRLPDVEEQHHATQESQEESQSSSWETPQATITSTPVPVVRNSQNESLGRPKRETKRPLRFEDYNMDA
ncbi:uncharacterized protein K02A2.6-like [Armigeres subalbatus]|uniref:uncharacterized protein K02A2.6-like n=1 Tax=Armigeres subalbatus TaxID=124917 RepID=UPI002ED4F253